MEEAQHSNNSPSSAGIRLPSLTALATIAGGLVATATILGFLLHGCGHVAYSVYLRTWGVQESLFPQSADWKVVRGYYALVLQSTEMFRNFPWRIVFFTTILLGSAIFILRLPDDGVVRARHWLEGKNVWLAEAVKSLLGSAALHYFVLVALLVSTFLAMLPGWIGERAGKQQAASERTALGQPGAVGESELWREGQKPMRGHVIASSETLIAFYDMDTKLVRTLDRTQFELRARPAKLDPADSPVTRDPGPTRR